MDAPDVVDHIIEHIASNYESITEDEIEQISVNFVDSDLQPFSESITYSLDDSDEVEFYLSDRVKTVPFHIVSEKVIETIVEYVYSCCPNVQSKASVSTVLLELTGSTQPDEINSDDGVISIYLDEELPHSEKFKQMILSLYRSMRGYHEEWKMYEVTIFFLQQSQKVELYLEGDVKRPEQLDMFATTIENYYSRHTTYERPETMELHPLEIYHLPEELNPSLIRTISHLQQTVSEQLDSRYEKFSEVELREMGYEEDTTTSTYVVRYSL